MMVGTFFAWVTESGAGFGIHNRNDTASTVGVAWAGWGLLYWAVSFRIAWASAAVEEMPTPADAHNAISSTR